MVRVAQFYIQTWVECRNCSELEDGTRSSGNECLLGTVLSEEQLERLWQESCDELKALAVDGADGMHIAKTPSIQFEVNRSHILMKINTTKLE